MVRIIRKIILIIIIRKTELHKDFKKTKYEVTLSKSSTDRFQKNKVGNKIVFCIFFEKKGLFSVFPTTTKFVFGKLMKNI